MADSQASLVEQVRSGNRQLQLLAAEGLLPLPPEQLIPLQVTLTRSGDGEVAVRAAETLRSVDIRVAAPYLAAQASDEVLAYFAAQATHPLVIETILRRRDVPRRLLVDLARRLPADLQEILILRQDAILDEPSILDALEQNPEVSLYTQRRVLEYREHLLPQGHPGTPRPAPEEDLDDAEFALAVDGVRVAPVVGEVDEQTGLSEGQIRLLPVPARIRLSRGASRLLRTILLRDPNARVAVSVLIHNNFSEQEVEHIARNRTVCEDVLVEISRHREWASRPGIQRSLVQNPRTPIPIALRLVSRLGVRDLREVSRDRNIPDAVRSTALRLYRIKRQ